MSVIYIQKSLHIDIYLILQMNYFHLRITIFNIQFWLDNLLLLYVVRFALSQIYPSIPFQFNFEYQWHIFRNLYRFIKLKLISTKSWNESLCTKLNLVSKIHNEKNPLKPWKNYYGQIHVKIKKFFQIDQNIGLYINFKLFPF